MGWHAVKRNQSIKYFMKDSISLQKELAQTFAFFLFFLFCFLSFLHYRANRSEIASDQFFRRRISVHFVIYNMAQLVRRTVWPGQRLTFDEHTTRHLWLRIITRPEWLAAFYKIVVDILERIFAIAVQWCRWTFSHFLSIFFIFFESPSPFLWQQWDKIRIETVHPHTQTHTLIYIIYIYIYIYIYIEKGRERERERRRR